MDLAIQLLMAIGVAAAVGIRPFLPVLLIGALARANIGFHIDGTDFAFLMSWPFLLGALVGVAALDFLARRSGKLAFEGGPTMVLLAVISLVVGALEASGAVAHGRSTLTALAIGIPIGIVFAGLGFITMRTLLMGARRRLDAKAAGALPLYAEGAGLLAAGAAVLFAPLSLVTVGLLIWLLIGSRRRAGEKFAGLRILR